MKELNALSSRYGLKYNYIGVRKKNALLKYFAKRHAGYFEHKKNDTTWGFSDLFSIKNYMDIFRGEKKSFSNGFSRKEMKLLRMRYVEFRTRAERALTCKEQQTIATNKCSKCGCKEWAWEFETQCDHKPPQT